jgi:hypothetical protein
MTPAEEATFIGLWTQRLTHEAMAQQRGCPVGTVKSHALIHQGKIQPRRSPQPTRVYRPATRSTPRRRCTSSSSSMST